MSESKTASWRAELLPMVLLTALRIVKLFGAMPQA